MSKLAPEDWRTFVKRLEELGFEGPHSGGNRPFMRKGDLVLTVPNPHKGTIRVDLLTGILKQARIQGKNGLGKNSSEKI
ncbi:MAG: type II toxin-antitoxin system HicA family toxin [Methanosarcina sp.]